MGHAAGVFLLRKCRLTNLLRLQTCENEDLRNNIRLSLKLPHSFIPPLPELICSNIGVFDACYTRVQYCVALLTCFAGASTYLCAAKSRYQQRRRQGRPAPQNAIQSEAWYHLCASSTCPKLQIATLLNKSLAQTHASYVACAKMWYHSPCQQLLTFRCM